ncbi:MAG: NAD(P)/FAD-dependent oxidoreductase [Coriobacteriales bacterium]|nr:NAD(P)/FAD-dependent oxidoreductase [Coriobacteriales bacterium]
MYDVVIIGAGIAGTACARELSRFQLKVLLLEQGTDVAMGATRANSGIVHGGYDPEPGTLKARYNVAGSRMYPQLAAELGFSFKNNGSMIVAFADDERPALQKLLERGIENGVPQLRIIESDELHALEPNLNPDAVAALLVPTGAITNPYGACIAFAENAVQNGVEIALLTRVVDIKKLAAGCDEFCNGFVADAANYALSVEHLDLAIGEVTGAETIEARVVINAAGAHSGQMNDFVSSERFVITPRAGEYELFDLEFGSAFTHTMFQVPTANGKGVLVSPTTGGNLIVGPNAVRREDLDDTETVGADLDRVLSDAHKTWPAMPWGAITNFAGVRSSCLEHPDFILGEPADAPGFFNIGGFDSPGLTAAPAVAREYALTIASRLDAAEKPDWNPYRKAVPHFSRLSAAEQAELVAQDPAWGRVVCRCETVTEAEIVAALRSPVPALTTDAIKWRTRAGMGRCQAGFCLPITAKLVAQERGIPESCVCKSAVGSTFIVGDRGCVSDLPHVVMPGDDGKEA